MDGTTVLDTVALPTTGAVTATLQVSTLSVGAHSLTAVYSGDGSFNTATGALAQTVQAAPTNTYSVCGR